MDVQKMLGNRLSAAAFVQTIHIGILVTICWETPWVRDHNEYWYAYALIAITLIIYIKVNRSDPGFLTSKKKGNVDPEASDDEIEQSVSRNGIELRYCEKCKQFQPLRTKHCEDCRGCVRTFDHHCPWVGVCIGENNRVYFYFYLIFQSAELFCWGYLGLMRLYELMPIGEGKLLVCALFMDFMFMVMTTTMAGYHSFLVVTNVTTWENLAWHRISYLKAHQVDGGSPFSQSLGGNLSVYCCSKGCPAPISVMGATCYDQVHDDRGGIDWEYGPPHMSRLFVNTYYSCC